MEQQSFLPADKRSPPEDQRDDDAPKQAETSEDEYRYERELFEREVPAIQAPYRSLRTVEELLRSQNVALEASNGSMAKSPDLLTAMAKRLRVVEERNRMLSLAVTEKDRELHELRTELLELRGGRSENRASETAVGEANSMDASYSVILIHVGQLSVTELKKRNAALEKQLLEMEEFLKDYGMVWVGSSAPRAADDDVSSGNVQSVDAEDGAAQKAPHEELRSPCPADVDVLIARLDNLNMIANEEASKKFVTRDGGHRIHVLQAPERVPVTIFKDGITIRRGPMRPYSSSTAQRFIKDVLDGYFPSEFREEYPEGVPFEIHDRRGESGEAETHGDGASSGLRNVKTLENVSDPRLQMKASIFLKTLPSISIRDGKVINIRDQIEERVTISPGSPGTLERAFKDLSGAAEDTGKKQTVLQIRSFDGQKILKLKVDASETISKVLSAVQDHWSLDSSTFELRSLASHKVLNEAASGTLEELGLYPNATLVMKLTPDAILLPKV